MDARADGCCCQGVVSNALTFVWARLKLTVHSWSIYAKSSVRNAGISLSLLYMTVLGFDNITYGFCLSQCVTEAMLGGFVGVSAVVGELKSNASCPEL